MPVLGFNDEQTAWLKRFSGVNRLKTFEEMKIATNSIDMKSIQQNNECFIYIRYFVLHIFLYKIPNKLRSLRKLSALCIWFIWFLRQPIGFFSVEQKVDSTILSIRFRQSADLFDLRLSSNYLNSLNYINVEYWIESNTLRCVAI